MFVIVGVLQQEAAKDVQIHEKTKQDINPPSSFTSTVLNKPKIPDFLSDRGLKLFDEIGFYSYGVVYDV